jgi:hypothetical protein
MLCKTRILPAGSIWFPEKSDRGHEVFKDFPNAAEKWGLQKKVITHVAAL